MFQLLRYFSLTSAIAIAVATMALVLFYRQGAVSDLVASAETHNVSLARSFANTIWPEFAEYITTVDEDGDGLRQRPETGQLHEALRSLTEGLPVLKIKIYNLQGLTVYSSQASQMGEDKSDNPGFLMSRDDGAPASSMSYRDSFSAFSGAVEDRDLVETYVAVQDGDGTVVGVLEIYTDVTPLMARLDRNTTNCIGIFLLIFASLYGALFIIVRRADGILRGQHLDLEESEKSIQSKNSALEKEINEREQIEAELRASIESAEAANRAKSEFLATVSHEVRTPMNGVLGMASLLLNSELAQEQQEYAETIQESGESLMTIIDDILDFSKAEAGEVKLVESDFELVPLIDHAVELFGPEAGRKGIDLAAYLAPGIARQLCGDAGRIRQILLNLIGNAIKFTKSGGVTLAVTMEDAAPADDGVVLRFEVSDTGTGIPAESLEKIFGPFTQADSSTSRSYGGTGLGLAISKKLIALMGGHIGVESELGRGSLFWMTLPLAHSRGQASPWADELPDSTHGRRVLVVDDAEMVRLTFEKQFSALGMEVTCAADVEAGLSCLRSASEAGKPFELAILDHMLSGADGESLAKRIRSDDTLDVGALILSSTSGQVDTDSKAQALGFDAALPKPLRPGLLLKCLKRVRKTKIVDKLGKPRRSPKRPADPNAEFRILLAEDNTANQKVVAALLNNSGFQIDTVTDGLQAVEAVRNRHYDLVLMDIGMPELDGQGATRQIRELPGNAGDVPIIAVTAHVMESDQEACIEAGMNDFIMKPIQRLELMEKIEFWLGLPESGGAAADAKPKKTHESEQGAKAQCAPGQGARVLGSTSLGRRLTMIATPAIVAAAPAARVQVNASPRNATPDKTPNSGTSRVTGITWFTECRLSSPYHSP